MKRLSIDKMVETVKNLRKEKGLTQDQVSKETGINRHMIGRLENKKYIPSVEQLEKLSKLLGFEITDLFEEREPLIYTAFRSSSMSEEERKGVNRMLEMMMASKQQILLRKAMTNEQE